MGLLLVRCRVTLFKQCYTLLFGTSHVFFEPELGSVSRLHGDLLCRGVYCIPVLASIKFTLSVLFESESSLTLNPALDFSARLHRAQITRAIVIHFNLFSRLATIFELSVHIL